MDSSSALIKQLTAYTPYNEQEEMDRGLILDCLKNQPDIFSRKNAAAHMTASAWLVSASREKALMAYHNIYHSWSWLGGHADEETDLLHVALKETKEESGLTAHPISEDIFSLEVLTVDGHIKRGRYVSSHLHLNITYLLEADDAAPLIMKPDENSGVRWFPLAEAGAASSEAWFRDHIYSKLYQKLLIGRFIP